MNYKEAREYLDGITKYGSVLGLESIQNLLEELGNPQQKMRFLHIAGTNGKGSVMAFVSSILTCAGYRVGRYISPTVFFYREKLQVNGQSIGRELFAELAGEIREACERLVRDGKPHPTIFEAETAMGMLYFVREGCDLAVLETGLGGLLDATNVVDTTAVAVITSISMDHMGMLGNTISEIAVQKAGIIKKGCRAVCLKQSREVNEVLTEAAKQAEANISWADTSRLSDIRYGLESQRFTYISEQGIRYENCEIHQAGTYQVENAMLAIEAAEAAGAAGFPVTREAVLEGLEKAQWLGRFSVISRKPLVILDGAHNRDGAARLAQSIETYLKDKKKIYIMGVFADKEYEEIAARTAPLADQIYTIETPDNPRALDAETLRRAVSVWQPKAEAADIEEAVQKSLEQADENTAVIAFGSLSHLGILYREFDRRLGGNTGGSIEL